MASDMIVFDSIARSNLAPSEKSTLRRAFERATGITVTERHMHRAKQHITGFGQAARAGGESLLMGGVLGLAHVNLKNGLDIDAGKVTIPLDAVMALAGLAGGVGLAHTEGGTDLTNSGAAAAAIFAFRKTTAFVAEKKIAAGGSVGSHVLGTGSSGSKVAGEDGGDMGADPLVALAESL